MKYHLSVLCIYLCLTIGSMEKLKSDIKETVKRNEIDSKKESAPAKETLHTKKSLDTKDTTGTKKTIEAKEDVKPEEDVKSKTETKEDAKSKTETKEDVKSKIETKEEQDTKEKIDMKENKERKNIEYKPKQYKKKFATKEDIPIDYLEYLKKRYNIVEDPVGEFERKMAEYDFYDDYDYETTTYITEDIDDEYKGKSEPEAAVIDSETVTETNSSSNETETCKVCKTREADKKLRLATIKSTILDKLGFSTSNLPNMTGKTIPKIPSLQKLIEQHEMLADAPYEKEDDYLPEDEYFGQVKRAYTIAQKPPDDFEIHVPGGCYFELPESVTSRKVKDASLWIYLEPSAFERKTVVEIYIYVVSHKAKPQHILRGPMRYKKTASSGWIEFKFAHIVHHWIKQPAANKGIIIHALDEDGNNHIITPGTQNDNTYIPMLEMFTVEHHDGHHRKRRSINHVCTEQERIETCCRYPLRVDFVQFGWDWVIAPTGYMANYCSGECRYRHMENNPQAYLIQQTPNGSGPCCTPSKFFPLAMLYFDHAHTVLYTYMQKMIVERCGCA